MATYAATKAALRTWIAGLLAAQSIPTARIFWDAFGALADDPPGPDPADPGSTIWARPVLSGEVPIQAASGWGFVEKEGVLVIELRCQTTADEDDSGLDDLASALADAIKQAEVDTASFGAAHVVHATASKTDPHQLNVISTYTRTEFD